MPITLGDTTISGLAAGGLPSGTVNATTLADNAVSRSKIGFQGAILQMVHNFSDATGVVGNVSTWLETFIVPTSANSRIFVMGTLNGDARTDDSVTQLEYNIGGGAWQLDSNLNSRVQSFSGLGDHSWVHISNGGPFPFTVFGFWHPITTSTVGVRFRHDQEASGNFWFNRSRDGQDNSENFGTSRSTLILIEVRGP
jgi:hypothetical protein